VDIPLDTPNEDALSRSTANYIKGVLDSKYATVYDRRDSFCKANDFKTVLGWLQSYDKAVVYSKGHLAWKKCGYGYEHHGVCMNDGSTAQVWDYDVYQINSAKNVHSFLWHCKTALIPNTGPNPDACGKRGLPVAFTDSTTSIPLRGSSGSQVYLGWTDKVPQYNYPLTIGGSPQYEWNINYSYNYAQVAALYYYYVGQGYSTSYALNELSKTIWGPSTSYSSSQLYDWLDYYGNGNLGLPS
jgi:hypothetical protein